ncbi:hypothetical protein [Streptomyces sp. NPDC058583]|uniref:hypothetical protein n=1 Tax=unclassified Streptomyces TaxID=2593676 RepID=UPI0036470FF7
MSPTPDLSLVTGWRGRTARAHGLDVLDAGQLVGQPEAGGHGRGLVEDVKAIIAGRGIGQQDVSVGGVATQALRAATDATVEQAVSVATYASTPDIPSKVEESRGDLGLRMTTLVTTARTTLKSDDDVAPAVPEPRRRWWRAA